MAAQKRTARSGGYSRRTFLTGLGIGLGAAGAAGVASGVSLGLTSSS